MASSNERRPVHADRQAASVNPAGIESDGSHQILIGR